MMIIVPKCALRGCIHLMGVRNDGDETTERPYCRAFPNGIPEEISYGSNLHNEPVKGDNGILFKAK